MFSAFSPLWLGKALRCDRVQLVSGLYDPAESLSLQFRNKQKQLLRPESAGQLSGVVFGQKGTDDGMTCG